MAPPFAIIIATAALSAVFFQALVTWAPDAVPALPSAAKLAADGAPSGGLAALSVDWNMPPASMSLKTLAHGAQATPAAGGAAAEGGPSASGFIPHESRAEVPHGWVKTGAAHASTKLDMRIALFSSGIEMLKEALRNISSPTSQDYRKFLTKAQVSDYMQPDAASVKAVTSWLSSNGIRAKVSKGHGDWVHFSTTVGKANTLFNADFSDYHHPASGKKAVRSMAYSLPAHMMAHVAVVHPVVGFPTPYHATGKPSFTAPIPKPRSRTPHSRQDPDDSCSQTITPQCIQEIYGVPSTSLNTSGNLLTVTGYGDQFAERADLKSFLHQFRPDMESSTTFKLQTTDGGKNTQNLSLAGIEANLDIQYTVGIATDVPIDFLSVGDNTHDGDLGGFLDTVNFLMARDTLPTVLSTSYGPDEDLVSRRTAHKLCDAFAALTAQGVSILFATGDFGVGATDQRNCTGKPFVPQFPSTCPYVTGVGATQGFPETVAPLSAGGFSNYFPVPDFQADAVRSYLDFLGDTNAGRFNASGRAFPDIAAYGANVTIVSGGENTPVDGTSCSTPIFASVIALINDRLMAAGQPPLGFLNPWLYTNASSALNDMTDGSNPGCGTDGFPATIGWDPVTGLGSPIFNALLAAAGLDSSD